MLPRPSSRHTTHQLPSSHAAFGKSRGPRQQRLVSFESIGLGRDDIELVDASFGYNNPCEVIVQEARKQFPGREMRILSISTGLGDVVSIRDSPASIPEALRNMALSSRRVARRINNQFRGSSQYVRFNVDRGLEDIILSDWEKASTISAHTHNYLADNEWPIKKFICNLLGRAFQEPRHFVVPFGRNKNFLGRESIMEQLLATIPPNMDRDDCQRTAVVGLGGIGKTQIALEVAYRLSEKHSDCSIFWVAAIDSISLRNAYRNIGESLGIDGINDENADVEELVKKALSDKRAGSWLLIVDNADDPDLFSGRDSLACYLPFSRKGSLLFTSRNREVVLQLDVPTSNILTVEGMSESEGFRFLEMHLKESQMSNREDTTKLLDVLSYLPLAIGQASVYMAQIEISTKKSLSITRKATSIRPSC